MVVLIFGASSLLGQRLAVEFADRNTLILVGRDGEKLNRLKGEIEKHNPQKATVLPYDLEQGIDALLQELRPSGIDLLINAASATSQFADSEIHPNKLLPHTMVDLIAPIDCVQQLMDSHGEKYNSDTPLRVIFISSWVSGIKSPDKCIYSSLKYLQESFLRRIEDSQKGRLKVTVVKIGARFSREVETPHHRRISAKIRRHYQKKDIIFYGITGRLLACLYHTCPAAMTALIHTSRKLRALKKA